MGPLSYLPSCLSLIRATSLRSDSQFFNPQSPGKTMPSFCPNNPLGRLLMFVIGVGIFAGGIAILADSKSTNCFLGLATTVIGLCISGLALAPAGYSLGFWEKSPEAKPDDAATKTDTPTPTARTANEIRRRLGMEPLPPLYAVPHDQSSHALTNRRLAEEHIDTPTFTIGIIVFLLYVFVYQRVYKAFTRRVELWDAC